MSDYAPRALQNRIAWLRDNQRCVEATLIHRFISFMDEHPENLVNGRLQQIEVDSEEELVHSIYMYCLSLRKKDSHRTVRQFKAVANNADDNADDAEWEDLEDEDEDSYHGSGTEDEENAIKIPKMTKKKKKNNNKKNETKIKVVTFTHKHIRECLRSKAGQALVNAHYFFESFPDCFSRHIDLGSWQSQMETASELATWYLQYSDKCFGANTENIYEMEYAVYTFICRLEYVFDRRDDERQQFASFMALLYYVGQGKILLINVHLFSHIYLAPK